MFQNETRNSTTEYTPLSIYVVVFIIIYIGINIVFSLLTNVLLALTILKSPSLRTPPNSHLLNIGLNNIFLCVCMIFSLVTVSVKKEDIAHISSITGFQLFIVCNCSVQYLCAFASIGIYRKTTMKRPSLCLRTRRRMVTRSISLCWIMSILLSLIFCLTFMKNDEFSCDTLNPFQREFIVCTKKRHLTSEQLVVLLIYVTCYIIGLTLIVTSYYSICKALNLTGTFRKSRVGPWNRNMSLSSESGTDFVEQQTTISGDPECIKPYTISSGNCEDIIVHYQRSEHTLAFEDIFALENPILATKLKQNIFEKPKLTPTLSNTSTQSTRSKTCAFTDISPSANLQRIQYIKNASALRNQSLRRDRLSLSSATKNSMIMFLAYLLCSLPLVLVSVPGSLEAVGGNNRIFVLIAFRLLFYVNASFYPTWYLIFSKRVKKCLMRLFENTLIKMKVRR